MRVLVTEVIGENGLQDLRDAGHDVDVQLSLSPEQLRDAIKGAHALIIRSDTKVTAQVLDAADVLKAVGRAGVGVDNIDFEAATAHGVMVINAPVSNITSAAEHAIALLMSLARHVPNAHKDLIDGQWNRSQYSGVEIAGKKIGIVGLGHVGVIVAQRMAAFETDIYAYDPYVSDQRAQDMNITLCKSIDDLFATCDIITVHLPKTKETAGLINASVLKNAQPHLLLINAARGGIVVEADLATALREGTIAGAGIDVFDKEPPENSPLIDASLNVVVTPHLGASTPEAQDRAGAQICEQITLALDDKFVPYAMNLDAKGASPKVAPFISVAQTCGRMVAGLADGAITHINVNAQGQIATDDCSILTLAALTGVLAGTTDEPVRLVNAPKIAQSRGIEVSGTTSIDSSDYLSRVVVTIKDEKGEHTVAAHALRRNGEIRIIQIDDHIMDVPRSSHFVVVANDDRPGMVGRVGSILGTASVNIDDMALGRDASGKHAMMVISTSSTVPDAVLDELNTTEGVRYARNIDLE